MSRSDIRLIAVILLLCFLFVGDPDVWDAVHEAIVAPLRDARATLIEEPR